MMIAVHDGFRWLPYRCAHCLADMHVRLPSSELCAILDLDETSS